MVPRYHYIYIEDTETPVPVQGIIKLVQTQENIIKDLLPNGLQILEQIVLKGGGPSSMDGLEPMKGVMAYNVHP